MHEFWLLFVVVHEKCLLKDKTTNFYGRNTQQETSSPNDFHFFPGVMKRELVAKADQKVNQGCEKFSGENLYRKRSSHPMMIEAAIQ